MGFDGTIPFTLFGLHSTGRCLLHRTTTDRVGGVRTAAPPVAPVGVPGAVLRDAAAELNCALGEASTAVQPKIGCDLHIFASV